MRYISTMQHNIWIKIICSAFIAFGAMNAICYFYFNPPLPQTNHDGFTTIKYVPNQQCSYMLEGAGCMSIDKNGFNNDGTVSFEDAHTVCMGSSQTEAMMIDTQDNYVSLLNKCDKTLMAYNIGISGQFFSKSMGRIPQVLQYFPHCQRLILESPRLPSIAELDRINYELTSGNVEIQDMDGKYNNPVLGFVKKIPLLRLIARNVKKRAEESGKVIESDSAEEYDQLLYNNLKHIREIAGPVEIYLLYLPSMDINGCEYVSVRNEVLNKRVESFKKACVSNGIVFINMEKQFQRKFAEEGILPYGFINTSFGSGHLNCAGHAIVADNLYTVITGKN